MGKNVKRLYEQFQPEHYDLSIDLDHKNLKFSGKVVISGKKTGRPSQRITLHQKDLDIKSASIIHQDKKGSTVMAVERLNKHDNYDEVRLHSKDLLYPGKYTLTLEFSGQITDIMHGLYPCYFKKDGEKQYLLATQFESHHAREVFPCIDEPEAKATFDLTLTGPKELIFLSNTPEKSDSIKGAKKTVSFERTPVMSSYLLAFVVGDMHCIEAKTKDGITVRTWASSVQPKNFLEFATKEAVDILEFYQDYFQTPYPLAKCDQVALPDFEVGAMENWGLITYREVALLTDSKNRTLSGEQYVAMVIAHELSHQWFGNLVTMKWWDDLWLNESFASFVEHLALDKLRPDWHQWESYTISDMLAASNRDIYKDVQPVGVGVAHPDEIHTIFDPAIVYAKGGRLLKMMREVIGETAFRQGLKKYFAEHAYKNTVREDLWRCMSEASGLNISELMTPWIAQSGQPILSVTNNGKQVHLSQQRFLLDGEDKDSIWPIPLLAERQLELKILDKKTADIKSGGSLLFNTKGSGHYLVDYTDNDTKKFLASAIADQAIPAEGRITRLNDMILLTRKGTISLVEALQIVQQCSNEPRDSAWNIMGRIIGLARMLTEGDKETEQAIKDFRKKLAEPKYKELGWNPSPDDSPNDVLLRQTILGLMLAGEHPAVIDEAVKRYKKVKNVEELPAELRTIIMSAVVRFEATQEVDKLMEIYQETSNPELQHSICSALTDVRDPKTADYIINKSLSENGFVRPQDIMRWYAYLMRNPYTRKVAWDWLTSSWDRLEEIFGGSKTMDYMPVYSASPLTTLEWEKKYKEFFTPLLSHVSLQRNIKIGFSEIEARVAWRKREESKLKEYFQQTI